MGVKILDIQGRLAKVDFVGASAVREDLRKRIAISASVGKNPDQ
jgi:hypothetical protein